MSFDDTLAGRVRQLLAKRKNLAEKKMFGGLAFLLNGHMCCAVRKQELLIRLDFDEMDGALAEPHTCEFYHRGRPMKGWILVESSGLEDEDVLAGWVRKGVDFAASLPAK
jgi:TfoX/Sxy family transcriptional regulator of competence genes